MNYAGDIDELIEALVENLKCSAIELPIELQNFVHGSPMPIYYRRIEYVYLVLLELLSEKPDEPTIQHRVERLKELGVHPQV